MGTWSTTGAMAAARSSHTATLLPSGKVLVAGGSFLSSAEVYDPATATWSPTGGMATARSSHTATPLPSGKVLVTGGRSQNVGWGGFLDSAEVYDPATGTWSPTGRLATARFRHTATLLPSGKVLVTGGSTSGGIFASAEVYDPATGTWSPTGSMATARQSHTATLLPSGKVLVAGGWGWGSESQETFASAEVYDPATGTWSPTGALASARSSHTATLLPSGKVLVTGGGGPGVETLASAEVYDPATGTWSPTGGMATARQSHTATLLPSGKVLVTGGSTSGGSVLASAEVYDPATGTWSPTSALASARSSHTATLLPSGKALVTGGGVGAEVYGPALGAWSPTGGMATAHSGHTATLLPSGKVLVTGGGVASAEVYGPATGTWSPTGTMTMARFRHTATLLPSGKVLVIGGRDPYDWGLASEEVYDPATGTWSPTGARVSARSGHTATLLPSGKVLVTGGLGPGRGAWPYNADVYDPATGTWSPTGSLATARFSHTATLLPSGKVLVTGGLGPEKWTLASAEVYDPATGTWSPTGGMATARESHTATLLPSGKVLVTGGYSSSGSLASAEVYDPATGTWSTTGAMASVRVRHTATLLPSGKVLVTGGNSPDVWSLASAEVYDPATGTWSTTDAMASARQSHTATLLPSGKVLVTGGYSPSDSLASAEVYQAAPVVLTPANGATLNNDRPTYSGTAEAGSTVSVIVDGTVVGTATADASGGWAFIQPVALVDGPHRVTATAAAGDLTFESGSNTFAVDATRPTAPVVLTPANGSTTNNNRPTYSGSAEPGSTVTVMVEGTAVGSTTANASGEWTFIQPVALVEGPHTVRATATDAPGNMSPESNSNMFAVDTTPPAAPVGLTPANDSTTNNNRPTYSGTAEKESTVTVWLDETEAGSTRTNAAGEWSVTPATALSEGLHRAVARATDSAGNASAPSTAHYFRVDTVPPAAPEVHPPEAIVHTRKPTLGGTAEAESTVTVWLDGIDVGTVLADEAGTWHFTPATALEDGRHLAAAIATDAAGNRGDRSTEVSFSVSRRGYYVSGCSTSSSSSGGSWPWALLLLALPRARSRPVRPARLSEGQPL
jgi:MYXO-CTERM domain-containing protein